jgi:hypothetical protein
MQDEDKTQEQLIQELTAKRIHSKTIPSGSDLGCETGSPGARQFPPNFFRNVPPIEMTLIF